MLVKPEYLQMLQVSYYATNSTTNQAALLARAVSLLGQIQISSQSQLKNEGISTHRPSRNSKPQQTTETGSGVMRSATDSFYIIRAF